MARRYRVWRRWRRSIASEARRNGILESRCEVRSDHGWRVVRSLTGPAQHRGATRSVEAIRALHQGLLHQHGAVRRGAASALDVWRQLFAARAAQEPVRPDESVAAEREHQTDGESAGVTTGRCWHKCWR